jgi:hypothetical protein
MKFPLVIIKKYSPPMIYTRPNIKPNIKKESVITLPKKDIKKNICPIWIRKNF